MDNLRPIVPKWDANHTALLWMRGSYSSYTSYNLDVVGLTAIGDIQPMIVGDLDKDGDIDLDDFADYLSGLHADLSGLSQEDAYAMGDINGDLKNDFNDFVLFRGAYDMAHGAGSLADAMSAVPEPSGCSLVALCSLGAALLLSGRWHTRPVHEHGTVVKRY